MEDGFEVDVSGMSDALDPEAQHSLNHQLLRVVVSNLRDGDPRDARLLLPVRFDAEQDWTHDADLPGLELTAVDQQKLGHDGQFPAVLDDPGHHGAPQVHVGRLHSSDPPLQLQHLRLRLQLLQFLHCRLGRHVQDVFGEQGHVFQPLHRHLTQPHDEALDYQPSVLFDLFSRIRLFLFGLDFPIQSDHSLLHSALQYQSLVQNVDLAVRGHCHVTRGLDEHVFAGEVTPYLVDVHVLLGLQHQGPAVP